MVDERLRHTPIPEGPAPLPDLGEPKGIKYAHFGKDQSRAMLNERLAQLEKEHYSHALNLRLMEPHIDGPRADEARVEIGQAKRALVMIEQAHEVISAELDALGD